MEQDLGLSKQAQSLWGKSDRADNESWLPLYAHMADSAAMAGRIWDTWVPDGTKAIIDRDIGNDDALARKVCIFLTGVHDIGKATPIFQAKPTSFSVDTDEQPSLAYLPRQAGLIVRDDFRNLSVPTHPIAGQIILQNYLRERYSWPEDVASSYACVVGGHHGTPPDSEKLDEAEFAEPERMGFTKRYGDSWSSVQRELLEWMRERSGLSVDDFARLCEHYLSVQAETILTGLTIMSDWIASNSDALFPLIPLREHNPAFESENDLPHGVHNSFAELDDMHFWHWLGVRADRAWKILGLCTPWKAESRSFKPNDDSSIDAWFRSRFVLPEGAELRPIQREAARIAANCEQPGLIVIEAPMGEGKTEAALAAAELLAGSTGRGGVCVALPTMATTDAMFGRVHDWVDALPQPERETEKTMWLAHGKAQLNEEFAGIAHIKQGDLSSVDVDRERKSSRRVTDVVTPEAVVSDWMWGRKKGVLANFLVCTVDQVLMGALQMKHVVLRQLALANKVVIIDECHAYDAYMLEYLKRVLEWLGGYGTPVILLSATLPERERRELTEAYLKGATGAKLSAGFQNESKLNRSASQIYARPSSDDVGQQDAKGVADQWRDAYPLITYTAGSSVQHVNVAPSGRASLVQCELISDDDDALLGLVCDLLEDGGCLGIVCNTVGRAQSVATLLEQRFDSAEIRLTHSRYMDIDRMANEQELRELLGPRSSRENGRRPERLIVVGTQVLEQSLDIDFDALITDIAPVDLFMQRLGRVHRHPRGEGERDRPQRLREASCFVRGIEGWQDCIPCFVKDVKRVYEEASLMEALAVLNLIDERGRRSLNLPRDIADSVRTAYGVDMRSYIPDNWKTAYDKAVSARTDRTQEKRRRAHNYLMQSSNYMNSNDLSLVDWFVPKVDETDEDKGQRAVRDTQETVEVMLLCKADDGVHLLPWVGDEHHGVECGARLSTAVIPDERVAKVAAQCSVRLPLAMCSLDKIDGLIDALEQECANEALLWQQTTWLAGRLALFLHTDSEGALTSVAINGFTVTYFRQEGLVAKREG